MPTPQSAILNRNMGEHQWYVHLSRVEGADLKVIKTVIQSLRQTCALPGREINLVVCFGPTLLADLTKDIPNDFQPFKTIKSIDGSGREAKGTQEELLFWMNSPHKDQIWKAQWDARQALKGHMKVARETGRLSTAPPSTRPASSTGQATPTRLQGIVRLPSFLMGNPEPAAVLLMLSVGFTTLR